MSTFRISQNEFGYGAGDLELRYHLVILSNGTPFKGTEMKVSPHGKGAYFHVRNNGFTLDASSLTPTNSLLGEVSGTSSNGKEAALIVNDGHTAVVAYASYSTRYKGWWWNLAPYRFFPRGSYFIIASPYDSHSGFWRSTASAIAFLKSEAANWVGAPDFWFPNHNSGAYGQGGGTVIPDRIHFKYNEYSDFQLYDEFGLWTQRWRTLAGNAYINAAQNLPSTANNSIQNVVQIIDLIKDIKEGNLGRSARDFVKSKTLSKAKEAWLTYRYSYETTKLDLQEYRELTERIQSLRSAKKIETFGQFATEVALCRCCFKVNVSDMIPHNFREWLHSYGFYLKAADVWDDIPFSFMVDWFWHLGDLLEFFDASGEAAEVRPADVWYSFLTKYDNQTCYFRIPGEAITNVPFLDFNTGSSTKVKAMRIADTLSIFT